MGAAPSIAVTKKQKRDNIRNRNMLVREVENFILAIFSCFPQVECMQLIISSETGLRAFTNFVESEHADDYLLLFHECGKIKEGKRPTMYVLRKYVEGVLNDYVADGAERKILMAPRLVVELAQVLTSDIENQPDPVMHMMGLITKVELEMVNLMAREQLSRFLSSRFYKNWRANERGRAIAATAESAQSAVQQYSTRISKRQQQQQERRDSRSSRTIVPADMTAAAFKHVLQQELDPLLRSQSWLAALVAVAEILPVSFALSKATPPSQRRGNFPLIFVNSKFEKLTGFSRSAVLGRSCRDFMQCDDTEKDKTALLSAGLRERQPVAVVLNNITNDGRKFQNVVALKPVTGHRGDYAYVMALHMEFDPREGSGNESRAVKQLEMLLQMLPDHIIEDQIEQPVPDGCLQGLLRFNAVVPLLATTADGSSAVASGDGNSRSSGGGGGNSQRSASRRRGNQQQQEGNSARLRARTQTIQEAMERKKRAADEAALAAIAAADQAFASQKAAAFKAERLSHKSLNSSSRRGSSSETSSVDHSAEQQLQQCSKNEEGNVAAATATAYSNTSAAVAESEGSSPSQQLRPADAISAR